MNLLRLITVTVGTLVVGTVTFTASNNVIRRTLFTGPPSQGLCPAVRDEANEDCHLLSEAALPLRSSMYRCHRHTSSVESHVQSESLVLIAPSTDTTMKPSRNPSRNEATARVFPTLAQLHHLRSRRRP